MNYFFSFFLIFGALNRTWSDDFNEDNRETLPLALIPTEENESDADNGVANPGLSSKALSDIHDLAKNISHSKGGYQETEKEAGGERNVRRSILKKASIAAESETMKAILQIFGSKYTTEEKIKLLENLEYLVHEYDVAVNFANQGGVKVIIPLLFSSNDKIASFAALVLGSAMQSNPTVKKLAMNEDVGRNLLEQLSHKSPTVVSRIIYALSSFLRNTPEAQEEFLSSNGVSKLADVLNNYHITTDTKLKIINLFNDLAVEQKSPEQYQREESTEKITAFQRSFANEIEKSEICKHVSSFLSFEDYDTHQKIVAAMLSLDQMCHEDFKNEAIKKRLEKLLKIYNPASKDKNPLYPVVDKELKRSLYSELKDLIKKIKRNPNSSTDSSLKLEL